MPSYSRDDILSVRYPFSDLSAAKIRPAVVVNVAHLSQDSLIVPLTSKMVALVERGAPRDFLDIFSLCHAGLFSIAECWALWRRRQILAGSDVDASRARLAIETHLERISLHRPLEQIADLGQREQARQLRDWFISEFLQDEGLHSRKNAGTMPSRTDVLAARTV